MTAKFIVTFEHTEPLITTALVEVTDEDLIDRYHIIDALNDYGFDTLDLDEFEITRIIDGRTGEPLE